MHSFCLVVKSGILFSETLTRHVKSQGLLVCKNVKMWWSKQFVSQSSKVEGLKENIAQQSGDLLLCFMGGL